MRSNTHDVVLATRQDLQHRGTDISLTSDSLYFSPDPNGTQAKWLLPSGCYLVALVVVLVVALVISLAVALVVALLYCGFLSDLLQSTALVELSALQFPGVFLPSVAPSTTIYTAYPNFILVTPASFSLTSSFIPIMSANRRLGQPYRAVSKKENEVHPAQFLPRESHDFNTLPSKPASNTNIPNLQDLSLSDGWTFNFEECSPQEPDESFDDQKRWKFRFFVELFTSFYPEHTLRYTYQGQPLAVCLDSERWTVVLAMSGILLVSQSTGVVGAFYGPNVACVLNCSTLRYEARDVGVLLHTIGDLFRFQSPH